MKPTIPLFVVCTFFLSVVGASDEAFLNDKGCYVNAFSEPNTTYYCGSLVWWPLNAETYSKLPQLDEEARSLYKQALTKYFDGTVSQECLAVTKLTVCASLFPRCIDSSTTYPVCTFLCEFYWERCPDGLLPVCETTSDDKQQCAFSMRLTWTFAVIVIGLMVLF